MIKKNFKHLLLTLLFSFVILSGEVDVGDPHSSEPPEVSVILDNEGGE